MSKHLDGVKNALDSYSKKQIKKDKVKVKKQKYNAPEKVVEKEVLKWAAKNGFDLSVVDSKQFYSENGQLTTATSESMPDLIGDIRGGMAAYIELKAPQSKTNISYNQYKFLERKIKRGCFGACVHSAEQLDGIWVIYKGLDFSGRIKFLINQLPNNKRLRQRLADENKDLEF